MKNKVCIVVPFRNREEHLKVFAPKMKEFLESSGTEGGIFIVEQHDDKPFNRAKLLNIGFDYVEKNYRGEFSHYCFHDVDMIPVNSDYNYCDVPTHLASRAQQFGYALPYSTYFGGVTIFDIPSFIKINGYSNEYWGWGAEDDDVFNRCMMMGIVPKRKDGEYTSLHHERNIEQNLYQQNFNKLQLMKNNFDGERFYEGLTTLEYNVESAEDGTFYTKIKVSI